MAFPYIKPLDAWVVKKLKRRETDSVKSAMQNPFVILSSTATVTKQPVSEDGKLPGQAFKDILDGVNAKYKGCIITNEINPEKLYSTAETLIGYDFAGVEIKVEGEVNRRVPKPIITELEVNTDGANNTLKTASLKIKIFTLKQLEMFELFFLRPSMHLLVEFGSNEEKIFNSSAPPVEKEIISKNNWTDYLNEYTKNFSSKIDARKTYAQKIEKSNGCYDFIAGLVTNFSYTIAEDLTYDVSLEISSANTMLMWLPPTPAKGDSKTQQPNIKFDKFEQWYKKLEAELDITLDSSLKDEKTWKNEFFNWQMIAEKQEETKASNQAYLSLRYILNIFNKSQALLLDISNINLDVYFEDSAGKKPLIPCNTFDNMISYSNDIIFPGKMPQFGVTDKKDKIVIKKNKSGIVEPIDNKINGYSFNLESKTGFYDYKKELIPNTKNIQYANLLNAFIKYDTFLGMWRKSVHRIDFLNQLVSLLNDNLYGKSKLILGNAIEGNQTTYTIIDKALSLSKVDDNENIYRFNVGVSGSIVRGFEFTFELSDLMQGQAAFSSISMIDSVLNPKDKTTPLIVSSSTGQYTYTNEGYSKFDMTAYANADNFISVDNGAAQITLQSAAENLKKKEELSGTGLTPSEEPKKTPAESTNEDKNLEESVTKKSVKFKMKDGKDNLKTLIYTDKPFLFDNLNIKSTDEKVTSALTFLEVSVIIDGTAGINCGEIFRINGVPEVYNKNGFFQVTNVKHLLEKEGWKTVIEAGYRIKSQ